MNLYTCEYCCFIDTKCFNYYLMILDFFVILQRYVCSEKVIFLNNLLLKLFFNVEVITKGLNTYEKDFQICHTKFNLN